MLKSQQTKNSIVINNAIELGELTTEGNGKGRKFVSRFIEPGIAEYKGTFGKILITKETIDTFINSMVGCPVIIKHKDITDENADKERVGVVSRVWYNEADGWFYCEGVIWDKQAIDLVKNQGWNVSCTYDFDSDFTKGTYHGLDYDMQFTGGEFQHLALVPNPRYERANIVINSKETIENEDHWITIGGDSESGRKGTHILVKDGETNKEATERKIAEWKSKGKKRTLDDTVREIKELRTKIQQFRSTGDLTEYQKMQSDYKNLLKEYTDRKNKGEKTSGDKEKSGKEAYQDIIDKYDKKHGIDKNDKGESWYDRASVGEIKTDIKGNQEILKEYEKEIERIDKLDDSLKSGAMYEKEIKPKYDTYKKSITSLKEDIEYLEAHLKKKQAKNSLTSVFLDAISEVFTDCLGELKAENGDWKEEEHNRVPAGSSEGGQFAEDEIKGNFKNLPYNLKTEDLNVVEFTDNDINKFKEYGSVKEYYHKNIAGKSIEHPDKRLGKVYFDNDGIGESIKINRPKNLFIVTKSIELVKQAKYDREEQSKHKREDGIVKFHVLYTKAKLPRKTRILEIKIAEKENGKKYYFLRPVKTIKNSLEYSAIAKDVNNDNSSLLNNEATIIMYDF